MQVVQPASSEQVIVYCPNAEVHGVHTLLPYRKLPTGHELFTTATYELAVAPLAVHCPAVQPVESQAAHCEPKSA